MEDRLGRIEAVKMIISTQELSTQGELMAELKKAGYVVAQPTLSRDLKLLQGVKVMNDEGRYVYRMPDTQSFVSVSDTHLTLAAMNRMGALHVKFSGSVAVMKTLPGHAAHVAYDIDAAQLDCVLGTVAGFDTVLIVCDETADRADVLTALARVVPMDKILNT